MAATLKRYAPENTSKEAVDAHVKRVADMIELSPDHAAILIAEIRNALGPAFMTIQRTSFEDIETDEHEDAKKSIYRVTALMDALAAKLRSAQAK